MVNLSHSTGVWTHTDTHTHTHTHTRLELFCVSVINETLLPSVVVDE